MASSKDFLTTQEFAKKAGVSTSTVSKWIRTEKIVGQKKSGKWMISASEISKVTSSKAGPAKKPAKKQAEKAAAPAKATKAKARSSAKAYSVKEFSDMTYLTEVGVAKWLKEGRLIQSADTTGQPMVDASNLDAPDIKRLLR